ncbi:MAG: carboxypeptidase-like regulatory domain-containing protein [Gemmatimonadaceae bacterium]
MRRFWWTVLAVVPAVLLGGASARAQDAATTMVFGTVRNASGVPISGADVWLEGTTVKAVSNDSGEFRIDHAPNGRQRVMVRRVGFRPDSRKVSLSPGDTRQVKFTLDGMLEELDAVIVTAQQGANGRMAGFWARRMVGVGVFITRADIDRRHPPQTSDLFHAVMGVKVISGAAAEPVRLATGRQAMTAVRGANSAGSNICPMQYYVDGMFMSPGTFSVDEIVPVQIEAIEIFRGPSEIPARFRQRETGCGLVVIWTREPPAKTREPTGTG